MSEWNAEIATDQWATWPWQQCRARREPRSGEFFGRCELRKGHAGDHALERGFDSPRWSTNWSDVARSNES